MNETPIQTTPPPVKKRAKKVSTPRAPRVADPGIAALRDEFLKRKSEYRKSQGSAAKLIVILKRVDHLTDGDRQKLIDELSKMTTPKLL